MIRKRKFFQTCAYLSFLTGIRSIQIFEIPLKQEILDYLTHRSEISQGSWSFEGFPPTKEEQVK